MATTDRVLDPMGDLEREAASLQAAELLVGARRRIAALESELELTRRVEADAASRLEELTAEGELIAWQEGEPPLVRMPPKQEGRRSVLPGGLDRHRSVLEPLGVAPREEPTPPVPAGVRTVYPAVADLDAKRDLIERAGVPFDDLVEPRRYGAARFLTLEEAEEEARKAREAEARKARKAK